MITRLRTCDFTFSHIHTTPVLRSVLGKLLSFVILATQLRIYTLRMAMLEHKEVSEGNNGFASGSNKK